MSHCKLAYFTQKIKLLITVIEVDKLLTFLEEKKKGEVKKKRVPNMTQIQHKCYSYNLHLINIQVKRPHPKANNPQPP